MDWVPIFLVHKPSIPRQREDANKSKEPNREESEGIREVQKMKMRARALNSSSHVPPTSTPPPRSENRPVSCQQLLLAAQAPTACVLRYSHKHSRRQLVIGGSSIPLLLWTYFQSTGQAEAANEENTQSTGQVQAFDEENVQSTGQTEAANEENTQSTGQTQAFDEENVQSTGQAEAANEENIQSTGQAQALDENVSNAGNENTQESMPKNEGDSKTTLKNAFFDVSINGEPAGRIVVELNGDNTPIGAARFASLVSGTAGISYRRKEFVKIMPNYVQHGGMRSYGVDAELAKKTGADMKADELLTEWETYKKNFPGVKNVAGSLGIIIRDPLKPPPKLKLVARKGKLEIDEEEVGTDPNGTEFVITTKDSPELDASTLVVGKVLDGMDAVEKISKVKTVQENTSSPYFRVAKLIGDKRAVVAERGFNRPYLKVIITNCGLLN